MNSTNPQRTSPTILDENAERTYWQGQFEKEPYYRSGDRYDDYHAAYETGYRGYGRYAGRSFDQAETDLRADWERGKGDSGLTWDRVKDAARAAWHRIERAMPGDADRDGR
jgi:hypothetical protein